MKNLELYNLLKTTQDQNILWFYLLINNDDYNYYISKNKNCSLEILKILIKSNQSYDTRENIAINPNSSIELLEYLSEDSDYNVRLFVTSNQNCSIKLLEKLSNDTSFFVIRAAKQQLDEKKELKCYSKQTEQ